MTKTVLVNVFCIGKGINANTDLASNYVAIMELCKEMAEKRIVSAIASEQIIMAIYVNNVCTIILVS